VLAEIAAAGGKAEVVKMDLASVASVRAGAAEILSRVSRIDVLINNAGIAGIKGQTPDGFELQFGTNHIGHFVLTQLLLPKLREAAPSRVVTVASRAHYRAKALDFDAARRPTPSATGFYEYGVSKLANVLFSAELGRREKATGVHTYSLHPGVVASDLWRPVPAIVRWIPKLFMVSNEEGARTSLHCATSPEVADETGLYYDECKPRRPSRLARDEALAAELWQRSEAWVG
jgi:NAD(P)-dependent dehydrogenase (short-subunit alcohol dehydrogenase family)